MPFVEATDEKDGAGFLLDELRRAHLHIKNHIEANASLGCFIWAFANRTSTLGLRAFCDAIQPNNACSILSKN
jgi:hypothetical protein